MSQHAGGKLTPAGDSEWANMLDRIDQAIVEQGLAGADQVRSAPHSAKVLLYPEFYDALTRRLLFKRFVSRPTPLAGNDRGRIRLILVVGSAENIAVFQRAFSQKLLGNQSVYLFDQVRPYGEDEHYGKIYNIRHLSKIVDLSWYRMFRSRGGWWFIESSTSPDVANFVVKASGFTGQHVCWGVESDITETEFVEASHEEQAAYVLRLVNAASPDLAWNISHVPLALVYAGDEGRSVAVQWEN